MYRTLLVTLDGSDFARVALDEVLHVADADSRVVLAEVTDSIAQVITQTTPAGFGVEGTADVTAVEQLISIQGNAAAAHLEAARAVLLQAGIEDVELRVLEGQPGPEIVKLATDESVDVIVMATHGRSGVRRAVLGSVSDYVVRNAGAPVLLVPSTAEAAQQGDGEPVTGAT